MSNDCVSLLRQLVRYPASWWRDSPGEQDIEVCAYCQAEFDAFDDDADFFDENQHADDCAWRLAVEYLASLDLENEIDEARVRLSDRREG